MSAVAMKFLNWPPPAPGRIRVLFVFGDDKFLLMFRFRRERIGGWRAEEKVALWLEVSRRRAGRRRRKWQAVGFEEERQWGILSSFGPPNIHPAARRAILSEYSPMRKAFFAAVTFGVWLFAVSVPALAQDPHQLHIDDTGKVLPQHQQHHARKGDKISWTRDSGANKSWYVKFTGDSPCAEGKQFVSGRGRSCTVNAVCNKAGDPGCKSYHYQSGTARRAKLNDPEIIIDP